MWNPFKSQPAQESAPAASLEHMQEIIELFKSSPEFTEALADAEMLLSQDDIGWLNSQHQQGELNFAARRIAVIKSRAYWEIDPLAKQAVRLWTDYAVGTGITYQAQDDKKEIDNTTQDKLDTFFKNRRNKRFTCSEGQQALSRRLLVDGEIFFAVFGGQGQPKVLRRIDPLQITKVITATDDDEEILGYRREISEGAQRQTLYYRDWAADDTEDFFVNAADPDTKADIKWEDDVAIYHCAFERLHKRGNGLLFTVCNWSKEHRRFMEARVSITQALAKFALKVTAKGNKAQIAALQGQLQSTTPQTGSAVDKNPPKSNGSFWLQNQGLDISAMPRTTGGAEARADGDQLKLMVSAGTNIMLHYFGDPSTGNLATAEAMELPMLKSFTSYQELWKDTWRNLFSIVLDEDIDEQPATIHINLPAMLKDDLQRLGQFLIGIHQVFPEVQVPEILQACLTAMGINNVDDIMKSIAAKKASDDASGDGGAGGLGNQLPPVTATGVGTPKISHTKVKVETKPGSKPLAAKTVEAMNNLAEAIRAL